MEKHIQMDNLSSNFYPLNWIRIEVNGNANTQLSQGDTDLLGLKLQHKKGSISKEEKKQQQQPKMLAKCKFWALVIHIQHLLQYFNR